MGKEHKNLKYHLTIIDILIPHVHCRDRMPAFFSAYDQYKTMFTSGRNIQVYLTVPERTRKRSWQFAAFYDTPCLQGQWLSSNIGPRFTCEDEGDDKFWLWKVVVDSDMNRSGGYGCGCGNLKLTFEE